VPKQEHKLHIDPSNISTGSVIDNGAFGSISTATFRGKSVVVKRIENGQAAHPIHECIDVILAELTASIEMKHPHVVQIEGMVLSFPPAGSQQAVESGFVFEYCERGNVFDNIFGAQRTLSRWEDRLRVACEVAEGMCYIHRLRFLHRDLNSRNVVLTAALRSKICDFGAARRLAPDLDTFDPDYIEGTPSTMSPEQLTGAVLTLSSDVWQMGVFLWEVLGVRLPWSDVPDPNDLATMQALVVTQRARLPPLAPGGLPPALFAAAEPLLHRTFATVPADRPSMGEVATVLAAVRAQLDPALPDV
jgi:serine/threonine protein kinase